jgi:hypothetical protein
MFDFFGQDGFTIFDKIGRYFIEKSRKDLETLSDFNL